MAYGVIESISMSTFVEDVVALEFPLSKHYIFLNPFIYPFICSLIIFASPLLLGFVGSHQLFFILITIKVPTKRLYLSVAAITFDL